MQRPGRSSGSALWRVPALVGMGAALLSLTVGHALALREDEQMDLIAGSGARRIRSEVRAGLEARMHALSMLAREWQDRFLPMRGAWESDVRLILSQSAGLESIAWLEPEGAVSWLYPPEAGSPPVDVEALRAGAAKGSAIAGPVLAPEGGPRLLILSPLIESGSHEGWLCGTYRSRDLLGEILSSVDPSFAVRVRAGDTELFRGDEFPAARQERSSRTETLALPGGVELRIEVEPSQEMLAAGRSFLPTVTLVGGLAMSLLLGLALGLGNVASARARALGLEIGEHQRAEEEIRRLNRELEERVRQRTAELSRSNEGLKQFASFLSHELRQPVGAQAIWAELLETECARSLGEEGRGYVERIRACARRMSELISAQLALAAASTAELESERTDLEAVLREVVSDLKMSLDAVGASVRVGPLPVVLGDSRQLYQLFRNLLDNAIKYRRPDVALEVAIRRGAPEPGSPQRLEIVVEDNGGGFSDEESLRIFDPAERLDRDDGEGHGLGLALCRRIVDRHGGELRAEGMPGRGARFHIALPVRRLADAPASDAAPCR